MFTGPGPKFISSTNSDVVPQPFEVHGMYSLMTTLPCVCEKEVLLRTSIARKNEVRIKGRFAFIGSDLNAKIA